MATGNALPSLQEPAYAGETHGLFSSLSKFLLRHTQVVTGLAQGFAKPASTIFHNEIAWNRCRLSFAIRE
jgi:hypothetical protein